MPEARDRISRREEVINAYINRRRRIHNIGRASSGVFVLQDEAEDQAGVPFLGWRVTPMGSPRPTRLPIGRGVIGSPRFGVSPNFGRSSALARGRENTSPAVRSGRGRRGSRRRGSILPAWYPRKPLQDITAVVRAIERRRIRMGQGESEGLETESPMPQDRRVHDPTVAHLELDISMISPHPTFGVWRCPPTIGEVPRILLNVTKQKDGDSQCLTPQEKLLNNIDTVEKVVMEELRKLKRTPSAKKAEREKKVRTLMSMR